LKEESVPVEAGMGWIVCFVQNCETVWGAAMGCRLRVKSWEEQVLFRRAKLWSKIVEKNGKQNC